MDTPERNQINTSLSMFEDSPVFNYINNLSPIKPVKSVHITQTFNSLSYSSPPSVFTSPHVTSFKESRFLRRHNPLGTTSNPEASSEDVNKVKSNEGVLADSTLSLHKSSELHESAADKGISAGDASTELSNEQTKFSDELPQDLRYNCGSPGYDPPLCRGEDNSLLVLPGENGSDVAYVQEGCETVSVEPELHVQRTSQIDLKGEGSDCDWDRLIQNDADLLIESEAFKGIMQKQMGSSMRLCDLVPMLQQSTRNNDQKILMIDSVASGSECGFGNNCSELVAVTDTTQGNLANGSLTTSSPNEKMNDKLVSATHRGIRRRCLDFEMASVRRKNLDDNQNTGSSETQSEVQNEGNEKQLLPAKRSADSQRCILPGIGLHLNALATLKDHKGKENENLISGRQLSLTNSTSLVLSSYQEHQHLSIVSVSVSSERELDPSDNGNGVQPAEDYSQEPAYTVGEDFNQNSPKKKRRKPEPVGDIEGCKRCNCKKSKCLKLYCECFAAGVYCIEPCSCQECFNKPIHEDTVLQTRKQIESRNPLAFAPKVIRNADSVPEIGDDPNKTPASARHKRGCNCKKSSCLKKYCECFQGGVGCSIGCRCEGCKNAFGRKDGSASIGIEGETEEETETSGQGMGEKAIQKTEIQIIEDHPDSAAVSTPLRLSRPLLPMPFSSKGKPPRSFVTTISGSGYFASQKLEKPNSLWSQSKPFQTVPDDEMLEILCGDSSPIAFKTSSPNGKRISSPNCEVGSSPNRRGGRKLILQSIPSFPSLTPPQP